MYIYIQIQMTILMIILQILNGCGENVDICNIKILEPTLENVFLELTKNDK